MIKCALDRPCKTIYYIFRPTGLLVFDKKGSKRLADTETSLIKVGSKYQMLDSQKLRQQFPMVQFDDSYAAVFDSEGGILRADKCLQAYQVLIVTVVL